jgi:hypothetical protein
MPDCTKQLNDALGNFCRVRLDRSHVTLSLFVMDRVVHRSVKAGNKNDSISVLWSFATLMPVFQCEALDLQRTKPHGFCGATE